MMKDKVSAYSHYISLLTFIAFSLYILYMYQEVLYTAHDRSEFIYGVPFFHTLASRPFGLIQYVGAWLTQLFIHPALGAGILCAIWVAIFYISAKAFRLKGNASALMLLPVAFLLTSVVDVGYWIYVMTIRGYWFSQSVGYLLMVSLLWIAHCAPRKWHLGWYVIGVCLYPVLGWFALLFVACLALVERPTWRELLGLFLVLIAAVVWHAVLYSNMTLDEVTFAGLPHFVTPSDESIRLSVPFWLLGAASLLIAMFGRYLAKWYVPVLCAIIAIVFTSSFMFYDKNYIDEMRMVRYVEKDNWKDVLDVFKESSKPTITMVMLKNVALMNEGGLLDRSFKMGNENGNIYNPDSLNIGFLEIAAPVTYYNYGLINEAFRLSFECAVQRGFSPSYLKMLTRCALANDETKLIKRYTNILHHNPFYTYWQPASISERIQELHESYTDELAGVESSVRYLVNTICLWHKTDSKTASEQALFYSMLRCDSKRFWLSLRKYVKLHMEEEFPLHAQEAYILYMDKAPEEKRMMIPVNEDIFARYQAFWTTLENHVKSGMDKNKAAERMRKEFGDTYWYYNIFGRKIY